MSLRIAILGATSHIAQNLVVRFNADVSLGLYCRDTESLKRFLEENRIDAHIEIFAYSELIKNEYEAIINCVGIADPKKQRKNPIESIQVTQYYDDMVISYIQANPSTRYINISSGAIFGTDFDEPIGHETSAVFFPNIYAPSDCYRISKLHSEIKHRALGQLPIVDVRVFSFFSKYIDLEAGFLLAEVANCLVHARQLETNSIDFARDYVSPDDLFGLMDAIIRSDPINIAVDAISARPLRKSQLLKAFVSEFGLMIKVTDIDATSVTGRKSEYYSDNQIATKVFGWSPSQTSIEGVIEQMHELVNRQRKPSVISKSE